MQEPTVQIRPYRASDWQQLWPILRHAAAEGTSFTYPVDLTEEDARLLWLLESPATTVVAVDGHGVLVGSAKVGPNHMGPGSHVVTASYLVDQRRRGAGVGRALGKWSLAWARSCDFSAMQFNAVVESNLSALALWRSLRFNTVGRIPAAFELPSKQRVDLLIMHRFL